MLFSIWNYTEAGTKQFQSLTSYESFTSSFICMLNDKHNCCSFAGFLLLQCSKSIFTYQEDLKDPGDLIF